MAYSCRLLVQKVIEDRLGVLLGSLVEQVNLAVDLRVSRLEVSALLLDAFHLFDRVVDFGDCCRGLRQDCVDLLVVELSCASQVSALLGESLLEAECLLDDLDLLLDGSSALKFLNHHHFEVWLFVSLLV